METHYVLEENKTNLVDDSPNSLLTFYYELPLSYIPFFAELKQNLYPLFLYDGGISISLRLNTREESLVKVSARIPARTGESFQPRDIGYFINNARIESDLVTLDDLEVR
jgi:hypothetical protein